MSDTSSPRPNVRSLPLCDSDKLALGSNGHPAHDADDQLQPILRLRQSPRAEHKAVASFKQDSSDDAMSIQELDESPSETRRRRESLRAAALHCVPDEVIVLAASNGLAGEAPLTRKPPIKAQRKNIGPARHHYEDIDDEQLDAVSETTLRNGDEPDDECQLVRVREHHMETIEVVSLAPSDRSVRASSLKRDRKTPEKKVTFMSSLEDCCQITPDGQLVKELIGTRYPTVFGDHEYEPIEDPDAAAAAASAAAASLYEPIQDPDEPETAAADEPSVPGPRRKSFIDSANDKTRQIRASISSQAGALRSKLQNLKRSRSASKDAGAADEAPAAADASAELDADEEATERDTEREAHVLDAETGADDEDQAERNGHDREEVDADAPTSEKTPTRTRATLNKLKSVQMPKIRKPHFKRPEFTKNLKAPQFRSLRMPDRPAFTRIENMHFRFRKQTSAPEGHSAEAEDAVDAADHSDRHHTKRSASEEPPNRAAPRPIKTKRFDFGTYPRFIQRMRKQSAPEPGTDFSTNASVSRDADSSGTQETASGRRKMGPLSFGTFPRMGRRSILTNSTERSDSVQDTNSAQFDAADLIRDESVERQLSERLRRAAAGLDGAASELGDLDDAVDSVEPTAEQKQLAEYDEENRVIHQISQAREGEFRNRRPPLRHQESDLTSEADSGRDFAWPAAKSGGLERLKTHSDWDRSLADADAALAEFRPMELDTDRLSTQETQSSGSSGYMRRKGVIEDIDRTRSPSDLSHRSADFRYDAGSGMLGGSKASTDRMDGYQAYDGGQRRLDDGDDLSDSLRHSRHFDEYPDEDDGRAVDELQARVDEYEDEFERLFYKHQKHLAEYRQQRGDDDDEHADRLELGVGLADDEVAVGRLPATPPPVAPRRRKRKSLDRSGRNPGQDESLDGVDDENTFIVYRTEHGEQPFDRQAGASSPSLPAPVPIARSRTRSRSQNSWVGYDEQPHSVSDVDSLTFDSGSGKYVIDMKETNGYAVVRKDPPPRPPAPLRKRGSARSLSGGHKFATLPPRLPARNDGEPPRASGSPQALPERPTRNYHTIGPSRPPRRTSSVSLGEHNTAPATSGYRDVGDQYEEIEQFQRAAQFSMQHRPLPAPPRPPRERRTHKSVDSGEQPSIASGSFDRRSAGVPGSSQDTEDVEETEVACQTDPTGETFRLDSFDQDHDAVLAPSPHLLAGRPSSGQMTLEEVLKRDQRAERDRQLADEQVLSRGIQKYRDANQRSFSERSHESAQRPGGLGSRPHTPSALIVERRSVISLTETDAALIVRPLSVTPPPPDDVTTADEDDEHQRPQHGHWLRRAHEAAAEDTADTEDERIVKEALRRYHLLSEDSSMDRESDVPTKKPDDGERLQPVAEVQPAEPAIAERPKSPARPDGEHSTHGITDEEKLLSIEPTVNVAAIEPVGQVEEPADEPPVPTPRRRASASPPVEPAATVAISELETGPIGDDPLSPPAPLVEQPSTSPVQQQLLPHDQPYQQLVAPDGRLHLTALDVDHLNVGAVQAQRIMVSDLHSAALSAQQLESGSLLVRGIELPAGFIDEIVDRVRTTERRAIEEAAAEIVQLARQRPCEATVGTQIDAPEERPVSPAAPPRPQPPCAALYPDAPATTSTAYYDDELDSVSDAEPTGAFAPASQPRRRSHSPATLPRRRRQHHVQHHLHQSVAARQRRRLQPADIGAELPLTGDDYVTYDQLAAAAGWSSGDEQLLQQQLLQQHHQHRQTGGRMRSHSRSGSLQRRAGSSLGGQLPAERRPSRTDPEPSIVDISGQLVRACSSALGRSAGQVIASVRAVAAKTDDGGDEQRQEANAGLIILIVIVAVVMMIGMGGGSGRAIHTHHWDFFNPPQE